MGFKSKKNAILSLLYIIGMLIIAFISIITTNFPMCLIALIMYIVALSVAMYKLIRTKNMS